MLQTCLDLFSTLNNRELATFTWLFLLVAFCLWHPEIRKAFKSVLDAFFQKPILVWLSLFSLYVVALCVVLSWIGLWGSLNLKTTVFWFLGFGIASFFAVNKVPEDKNYFLQATKEQLKVVLLLDFLVNFYTFNYIVELIILPIVTYVYLVWAYAEGKEEFKPAHRFLTWVLTFYGVFLVINAFTRVIANYNEILNQPQLIELVLIPILSIGILPFIYVLALVMTYERLFIRLDYLTCDKSLAKQAKQRLLWTINLNLKRLMRFSNSSRMIEIKSQSDLTRLIPGEEESSPII